MDTAGDTELETVAFPPGVWEEVPEGYPISSTNPDKLTAATYLGLSRRTVYRLIRAGALNTYFDGPRHMVTRASLDGFIRDQREEGGAGET